MTRLAVTVVLFGVLFLPALVAAGEIDDTINYGVLDFIHLMAEPPARDSVVVVRLFDASKADLGTGGEGGGPKHVQAAQMMQAEAPMFFAWSIVYNVRTRGPFAAEG